MTFPPSVFTRALIGALAILSLGAPVFAQGTPPTVQTPSASSITTKRASVQCAVSAGSADTTVFFEYGTTTAYGSERVASNHVPAGSVNHTTFGDLTSLQPATTYHLRCRAVSNAGTTYGPDATFTTLEVPEITTGAASSVTDLSAVLNGTLNAKGGSYRVRAQYGPTTSYGRSRDGDFLTNTSTQPCAVEPSDLQPATTYHYRLLVVDQFNATYYGADQIFTTAPANTPPTVHMAQALTSSSHATTAQLYLNFLTSGSSETTVSYEYGPTTSYGSLAVFPTTIATNTRLDNFGALVYLTGLTPGTTYHFRGKATNAQGTVYTPDATFSTAAAPVVTTGGVTGLTDLAATLNGTVNTNGLNMRVLFDLGTTTAYEWEISTGAHQQNTSAAPFSVHPQNLEPGTTYHYRVKAVNVYNSAEAFYGEDLTFTTPAAATAPTLGSAFASSIKGTSAQVNCQQVFSGSSTTTVVVEYGTTTAYGSSVPYGTPLPLNNTFSISVPLTGLTPGTLYHARLVATNAQGSRAGADVTFTTSPPAPPAVGIISTTQVRSTAVAVQAVNVAAGSSMATVVWDYGTTTAYGTTVPANAAAVIIPGITESTIPEGVTRRAVGLFTGLLPGTTYHYRCRATNGEGSASSSDATFTTSTGPLLTTQPATAVTDLNAVLHGAATASAGVLSSLAFEIGTTTAYGRIVEASPAAVAADATEIITATVSGLLPDTTYHYRLSARDQEENVFTSADMTFTTGPAATPPTAVTQSPTALAAVGATLQAQVETGSSPTTVIFEYGLTIAYGAQIAHAAPLAPSQTHTVGVPLPGLTPGTTYHYRVVATNTEGASTGADISFTTPAVPTVTTNAATFIQATRAALNGTFHRQGGTYIPTFDYGETTAYGLTATPGLVLNLGGGGGGLPIGGGGIIIGGGGNAQQTTSVTALVQPQRTYHFRLRLTDNYGSSYLGADATFTTPLPVEAWRKQHFGYTAGEGDAADGASPASDGIPNLMKYALWMNPAHHGTHPPITLQEHAGARYLTISFPRNPDAIDITYEVQAADSLDGPWSVVATIPPGGTGTGPGFLGEDLMFLTNGWSSVISSDIVHARDVVSLSEAPRRFLRLKVRR